jgi:RNA polymerase sigma factor (sigma-70 family)
MAVEPVPPVLRHVRRLVAVQLAAAMPDDQLLQRFVLEGDQTAFEALVRRHGPLVLSACRRVLRDRHTAEDAFQATFLVLARKAGFLKQPRTLGPWLYGVACRTALKIKSREARRRVVERCAASASATAPANDLAWQDLWPLLDEAVAALPEASRVPFVLHHLQGLTVAEIARRLDCPQGTVAARLSRARERLRTCLGRRGVTLSAAALAAALTAEPAFAFVPATLAAGVVEAAAGKAAGVSALAALMKGVVQTMSMTKLKVAALLLLTGAVGVGIGVNLPDQRTQQGGTIVETSPAAKVARREADETRDRPPTANAATGERYYAGGFRTLRGFEFRDVGPKEDSSPPVRTDTPVCQQALRATDRCWLVPFLDTGTVEPRLETKDYRVSAGFGLRLVVPMLGPVPIALDFGFPIVKERDEREQIFNFWIGFFS